MPKARPMINGHRPSIPISVDEKPGIQAIGLTAPDLPPGLAHRFANDPVSGRQKSIIVLIKLKTCLIVRGFIMAGGLNDDQGLPSQPGKAATVGRDYEYVRLGTVSLLAGMTRTRDRSSTVSQITTAVASLLAYCRCWMTTIRLTRSSASCWIIMRRTSRRKPWRIWRRGQDVASLCLPTNRARGSI